MTFHPLMPLDVLVTVCTNHHRDLRAAVRDLVKLPTIVVLLALAATGCTTHHRLIAAPTYAVVNRDKPAPPQPGDPKMSPPSDVGVDVAGELTAGEDDLRLVLAGAARAGFGVTGGGFRAGLTLGNEPRPYGFRGTVSIGPSFTSDGTLLDVRGAFSFDYGVKTGDDDDKRTTFGVELFASSVGSGGEHRVMLGIGLSVGSFHHDSLGLAASPPED